MTFRGDNRAQSTLIGFILLFGILVLAFAGYQAFIVPDQNAEVEFDHNQNAQNQMQDVRSSVIRAGGTGSQQSAGVQLGTRYPTRLIALNPPPTTGTLQTSESMALNVNISNAAPEDSQVAAYWEATDSQNFTTQTIEYRPSNNEHTNAPTTVIEQSVLYNRFEEGTQLPQTGQTFIAGNRSTLILVDGEYQRSATEKVNVDVDPVSSSSNRVAIQGENGDPVRIDIETQLGKSEWEDVLDREIDDENFDDSGDTNVLTIERPKLNLRTSNVNIGSTDRDPDAEYITDISGDGATIPANTNVRLVAEVRDRYNNPVSGEAVVAEANEGTLLEDNLTTDSDGRVEFVYISGSSSEDITAELADNSGNAYEAVGFEVEVFSTGEGIETPYDVEWASTQDDPVSGGSEEDFVVTADLENLGSVDFDAEIIPEDITGAQADFSFQDPNDVGVQLRDSVDDFDGGNATVTLEEFDSEGVVTLLVTSGGANDEVTVRFEDEEDEGENGEDEPAESELSNLDIAGDGADATITEGNQEDVSVDVTNIGDVAGEFDVSLEITPEGETEPAVEETEEEFTVNADDTETLTFESVTGGLDAGNYDVEVSTDDDVIVGELRVSDGELPSTLTAEVTEEGGPNDDWIVTFTYDGDEEITVTADPDNRDAQTGTIGPGGGSTPVNLGSAPSQQIYPITVSGQNDVGESCESTLTEDDDQINVCS